MIAVCGYDRQICHSMHAKPLHVQYAPSHIDEAHSIDLEDRRGTIRTCRGASHIVAAIATLAILTISFLFIRDTWGALKDRNTLVQCAEPAIRKEWGTLTRNEKLDFIRAVRCLSLSHSGGANSETLHDQFARAHIRAGGTSELTNVLKHGLKLRTKFDASTRGCCVPPLA